MWVWFFAPCQRFCSRGTTCGTDVSDGGANPTYINNVVRSTKCHLWPEASAIKMTLRLLLSFSLPGNLRQREARLWCDVHQNQDVMSNKRHPDGRAGLPSAAVVLNKCMTFFFFFLLFTAICFIFFFLWVRVTKAWPTPRDGCGVNNMPHPVFLPPLLFLSLGLCWVRKCVFGGDGGGGVGTQAVCLGSPLVGEERDRRRKESPVCSFTLPVTQQNFREEIFFCV